ncbi:hypothetical protein AJ87_46210 [Rhizobium yanglingense]|nr:hypothetical protein AJ87_46210 [Rhizobium yanglingense]
MVRLVKGAYWDAEIKRAQLDGLEDFPVFTRKVHTDVSYIACARKLLAAVDFVFPQFATHNAQTLATIYHLAGPEFQVGKYEFQCLHGMGEPLYDEVVGKAKLNRPCRIYAPVGTHETLLAYLVRRLLENGANSSFVNRISDPNVSVDELVADPVDVVEAMPVVGMRMTRSHFRLRFSERTGSIRRGLTFRMKQPWRSFPLISPPPFPETSMPCRYSPTARRTVRHGRSPIRPITPISWVTLRSSRLTMRPGLHVWLPMVSQSGLRCRLVSEQPALIEQPT